DTVERIGDKLSAARIIEELWVRLRAGDGVAMLGEAIREHPRPFALMGLGVGLLAVEQSRQMRHPAGYGDGRHGGAGTWQPAEGRVGPYRGDAVDRDDPDWEHASTAARVKGRVGDAKESIKDAAHAVHHTADTLAGKAGELKDAATAAGGRAREEAHHLKERAGVAREKVAGAAHAARSRIGDAAHTLEERAAEVGQAAR